jgi:putative ATP-binding cassette transporter
MEFFRLFREESQGDGAKLVTVTIFSGVVNALLVAVIIMAAKHASSPPPPDTEGVRAYVYVPTDNSTLVYLGLFAMCLLAFALTRRYVLTRSAEMAEHIVARIRIRIMDKIRHSNLLLYERVGRSHIYSALNESTFTLSSSASYIATGLSAAFMLGCATLYIAYLSRPAFVLTVACITVGVLAYSTNRKSLNEEMQRSNEQEKHFFDLLTHLLDGFKEIKMHRPRSDDLYTNFLVTTAEETRGIKQKTARRLAAIGVFGQIFLYLLLAVIVFVLPSYSPEDAPKIGQIAAVILFIMGPLGDLVGAVPFVMRSNAAVVHIAALESELDASAGRATRAAAVASVRKAAFQSVALQDIVFSYDDPPGPDSFRLGPTNLEIEAGKILFLVGGNGSGKSTLLKVLTGLYPPRTGNILIDGVPVEPAMIETYRSFFSTVFTDFHLFDRLFGLRERDPEAVQHLIARMHLNGVAALQEDGRFASTNLSTGQRKRLALIVALLEERPILVLDEFAADQDPPFRKYFYEVLLREFKSEGRTIIAATHDDHYFEHADRILKMEFGQFEDVTHEFNSRHVQPPSR